MKKLISLAFLLMAILTFSSCSSKKDTPSEVFMKIMKAYEEKDTKALSKLLSPYHNETAFEEALKNGDDDYWLSRVCRILYINPRYETVGPDNMEVVSEVIGLDGKKAVIRVRKASSSYVQKLLFLKNEDGEWQCLVY